MTRSEEEKIVRAWVKGREWVRCSIGDHVLTVKEDRFTMFARDDGRVEVKCAECMEDESADV